MKNGARRGDVFDYIANEYGTVPEYLFKNDDDTAVLRCNLNKKWYGIVINVKKARLGLKGDGTVDVINLKCEPNFSYMIRGEDGIFPAYHMNKEHWISVLLDGSLDKEKVFSLIDISKSLVESKNKKK